MVFKRRTKRSYLQAAREFLWPRGGWRRAATYVSHRLRRLPDEPHRIARGIFAGVFISFTPLFGFHFLGAALIAWALRGNILAALLATFAGNPLTTPFIALSSIKFGQWMLGIDADTPISHVFAAFGHASAQLWANFRAIFTAADAHWDQLGRFVHEVYFPYLVGGLLPGLIVGMGFYYLSIPLVKGYQKLRQIKLKDRIENRRAAKAAKAETLRLETLARSAQNEADQV